MLPFNHDAPHLDIPLCDALRNADFPLAPDARNEGFAV